MVHGMAWMDFWSLESFLEEKKGKAGVKVNSWAQPFPEFCWSGAAGSPPAPWAVLSHPGGTFPLDGSAWASISLCPPSHGLGSPLMENQGSLQVTFLPLEHADTFAMRAEHLWRHLG